MRMFAYKTIQNDTKYNTYYLSYTELWYNKQGLACSFTKIQLSFIKQITIRQLH